MPGLFTRVKNWVKNETVASADINTEFNNIITNFVPNKMDDYSVNVAQMQSTADPGEVGTESLASTTAGELERLRFILQEATGMARWYESPPTSLSSLNSSVSSFLVTPNNRIISGKTTLGQPTFLVPNVSSNGVACEGSVTPLVVFINGVQRTLTTDITTAALTDPPTSNNTAAINDVLLTGAALQWAQGEGNTTLDIDTALSEWTSLVGSIIAFKTAAATDYYSVGFLSSVTALKDCYHGYFFNNSDVPIKRIRQANNEVLTLAKLNYIFLVYTTGLEVFTLEKTPNRPSDQVAQPTGPATGDFWHNRTTDSWQKWNGSTWEDSNGIPIGVAINDENSNTVGARSSDLFKNFSSQNTIRGFRKISTSLIQTAYPNNVINVYGSSLKFEVDQLEWDNATVDTYANNTTASIVGLYRDETGAPFISDVFPYDRRHDLEGWYHPWRAARCFGLINSSNGTSFDDGDVGKVFFDFGGLERTDRGMGGVASSIELDSLPATGAVYAAMTGAEVKLKTNGNPVVCSLVSGSDNDGSILLASSGGAQTLLTGGIQLKIDTVAVDSYLMDVGGASATTLRMKLPGLTFIAHPKPGEHTFALWWKEDANSAMFINHLRFVCYELGQVGDTTYNSQQEF